MIKCDPIIAVKDISSSSKWYQTLLDCRDMHEGDSFAILTDNDGQVLLCLHLWEKDEHPTMQDPNIVHGNGLILYFRTTNLNEIWRNVQKLEATIEEGIHLNTNSGEKEFSLRDPDNYYITIST